MLMRWQERSNEPDKPAPGDDRKHICLIGKCVPLRLQQLVLHYRTPDLAAPAVYWHGVKVTVLTSTCHSYLPVYFALFHSWLRKQIQ